MPKKSPLIANEWFNYCGILCAWIAGIAWTWAVLQLPTRVHEVLGNKVIEDERSLIGFMDALKPRMVFGGLIGLWVLWRCYSLATSSDSLRARANTAGRWLLGAVPLLICDLVRSSGVNIPMTWLETLWLCLITGEAFVELIPDGKIESTVANARSTPAILLGLATIVAAMLWYWLAEAAYLDYMLGYPDFGHYARRIVNTWNGRGFLMESPHLSPFWDHFNPGLALLAPLWGMFPDPRLFMVLQVLCLTLGVPIIYGIARSTGASELTACIWGGAYLLFPSTGQLSLTCGYGWHPISLALPLVLAAVWLLQCQQRFVALCLTILAFSFEETAIFVCAWLALACWIARIRSTDGDQKLALIRALSSWQWAVTTIAFFATFLLVSRYAGFAKFQMTRLSHLGDSMVEVAISAITSPNDFWPQLLRFHCIVFVVALITFVGFRHAVRGWSLLIAGAVPVAILCLVNEVSATSIAFQYVTLLIPILFLAAMQGSLQTLLTNRNIESTAPPPMPTPDQKLRRGAWCAIFTCAMASVFFGAWPWSTPTLNNMYANSYMNERQELMYFSRVQGTPGNDALNEVVKMANHPNARVLSTGRIASHLLDVERLELVSGRETRDDVWRQEVKPGQSTLMLFDFIVMDFYEQHHQMPEDSNRIFEEAMQAGFKLVFSREQVVLLQNPNWPRDER